MNPDAIEYIGEAVVGIVGFIIGWFSKFKRGGK